MSKKVAINLNGPEGNAWVLMSKGHSLCRQLHRDFNPIREEMMSGDYKNLCKVFKREFGDYYSFVKH